MRYSMPHNGWLPNIRLSCDQGKKVKDEKNGRYTVPQNNGFSEK